MKKQFQSLTVVRSVVFSILFAGVMGLSNAVAAGYPDTNPDGSINTGNASIFTVLTHGDLTLSGSSSINGKAGVGDSGNASLSGSAQINGDLVINNKGKYNHSGSSGVTGTITKDQTTLDNAWADAISLSNAAQMEMPTPAYASITNVNLDNGANISITGGPNQKIVLSLQNFQLNHSSTFTLQGTATTSFIINVAKNFSLDSGSQIVLLGVPAKNVLFNLIGGGTAEVKHASQASGTILALNRTVNLTDNGTKVTGRIIAQKVALSASASVVTPVTNP